MLYNLNKVAELIVDSYVGYCADASHVYGTLRYLGEKIEFEYPMTQEQADKINNKKGKKYYWEGFPTKGFDTLEQLREFAINYIKENNPEVIVLLEGDCEGRAASEAIWGDEKVCEKLNSIHKKVEELGYYDNPKNDYQVDQLGKEFMLYLESL